MAKVVNNIRFVFLLCLGIAVTSHGQELTIEYKKTIQLKGANLGDILNWLSSDYGISFSYSRDRLPIDKKVVWSDFSGEMEYDLKDFFKKNQIQFRKIGDQYVLRYEAEDSSLPSPNLSREDLKEELGEMLESGGSRLSREYYDLLPDISTLDPLVISDYQKEPEVEFPEYNVIRNVSNSKVKTQVSFIPGIRSYGEDPRNRQNNVSFNILWGRHQNLDGVEFGGLVNETYGEMDGFQIAGIANMVGGSATGFQFASWLNLNEQHTQGVQISGAVNYTKSLQGVQFASASNISSEHTKGAQVTGGINIGRGADKLVQVAGGFNISTGESLTQVSGLFNSAEDVKGFQVSPFFNKAKNVKGSQIGLINISDTVSGLSLGLINYVKKGYNRLEFGNTSAYHAYLNVKLGSYRFYNNFRFGYFTKDQTDGWALGYGVGTVLSLTPRSYVNADFTADLLNLNKWSKEARVLYSISTHWSYRMSKRMTVFIGPAVHWLVMNRGESEIVQPFIGPAYGLNKVHETQDFSWWNWVGWSVGLRFG